ncbi:hypothetical protein CFTD6783_08355 [Campylobacter fetus subsp. testudinum]|uniref:hypothetical protein n=1 Tax=Campylobacter fetus TaxID=196 RepID=UPI0008188A69|nr:hypothetical protein [Campylobacter fetus]OCS09368.1 hypothetical protein CFTD6783_08355 [Campylobacter fetus subsp. testudinum]
MNYPSIDELKENYKKEVGQMRAKDTCSPSPLRYCDPKYQPTMDKWNRRLRDVFYSGKEPDQKYFKEKDTQVAFRLNILKRHCAELVSLGDELENEIKLRSTPYHIKETAMKIISYIKGY